MRQESLDAITRMFVEEPFAGWYSAYLRMPRRNVIPKTVQKPHPPLWVACSRRETRLGTGAPQGAAFSAYALAHYYGPSKHASSHSSIWKFHERSAKGGGAGEGSARGRMG